MVLVHDNVHPHLAACTQAKPERFSWELFDHPPYDLDITLSDYRLFTYLKNWLRSLCFIINEELMEGVKVWLSSQVSSLTQAYINLFPEITSLSIQVVTMLRSSLGIYTIFLYNTFFSPCLFC
jgi:hypothetical protein